MTSSVPSLPLTLGQLRVRLWAGLLLLNLLVLALSAYALWRDRRQHEQRVVVSTSNLAQVLERDVSAVFGRIDYALHSIVEEIEGQQRAGRFDAGRLNDYLKLHRRHVPEISGLRITDAQGRVQFGENVVPGAVDLSDRPHFRAHRDRADAGLMIGKPVQARIDRVWSIPIARRLNRPDGGFAGVIYANLPVDTLAGMFAGVQLGEHGVVALRNLDYELMARFPAAPGNGAGLGQVAVSNELLAMLTAGQMEGSYFAVAPTDLVQRVHTFYRLRDYPLYLIVGQSPRDYLADWYRHAWQMLVPVLLFALTSLALAAYLLRNWRRQLRISEALRENEERWGFALEGGGFAVWDWDMASGKVELSKRGKALFGFDDHEIGDTMAGWESLCHPSDLPRLVQAMKDHFRQRTPTFELEFRMRCKDGSWKWVHARGMVVRRAPDGRPLRMIGTHVDISERRRREDELRLSAAVFQIADEAMVVTSPDNRIVSVNPAFTRITGYAPEEVIGRNPSMLSARTHGRAFYETMWHAIVSQGGWSGEVINRKKSGEAYLEWLSIRRVVGEDGQTLHHVAVFSDITARKAAEDRMLHLALHDALTDLPNRTLLTERVEQAVVRARRDKSCVGLIYFDLDKFKPINDSHGHEVGDQLLRAVAARVLDSVRASDTVARLGGDEFVVLLPAVESGEEAVRVAEKILQALARPFEVGGHVLQIGSSLGVAVHPEHGGDAAALTRHADAAMYHAKNQGRNRVVLFHSGM